MYSYWLNNKCNIINLPVRNQIFQVLIFQSIGTAQHEDNIYSKYK